MHYDEKVGNTKMAPPPEGKFLWGTVKLGNRGQIVIPKEARDKYGLQEGSRLVVLGDDDQSIYKFRGANIYNILNFEKHFEDAKVIKLEQNYRSTQNILDAANSVISNNVGRKDKRLWTDNGAGDRITFEQLIYGREKKRHQKVL